jgi:hypothetical protein
MPDSAKDLQPLKIACTSSDCGNDLHCFKRTRKMSLAEVGRCRSCGADLIDWERVRRRDPADADFTFRSLRHELVRHHFWHVEIDEEARLHARRKGTVGLKEAAEKRIRKYIGIPEPVRDGRQTPFGGNILYYAQHALACCCRTCMEYWHGIPKGTPLSEEQISYFTDLMLRYIDERMPNLTEYGEKIPPRRRASSDHSLAAPPTDASLPAAASAS